VLNSLVRGYDQRVVFAMGCHFQAAGRNTPRMFRLAKGLSIEDFS